MTQPGLIFIFKIKTCTTFTKDLNVYAFIRISSSVLEIAGRYKNYGTVYIISTISMHALCNIDLTAVYVDKVQCKPAPPPFLLVLNYLFFFRKQGKLVYDMLYNVTKSKHS